MSMSMGQSSEDSLPSSVRLERKKELESLERQGMRAFWLSLVGVVVFPVAFFAFFYALGVNIQLKSMGYDRDYFATWAILISLGGSILGLLMLFTPVV